MKARTPVQQRGPSIHIIHGKTEIKSLHFHMVRSYTRVHPKICLDLFDEFLMNIFSIYSTHGIKWQRPHHGRRITVLMAYDVTLTLSVTLTLNCCIVLTMILAHRRLRCVTSSRSVFIAVDELFSTLVTVSNTCPCLVHVLDADRLRTMNQLMHSLRACVLCQARNC